MAGASRNNMLRGIIDDATKRLGGAEDKRCRVTVNDRFRWARARIPGRRQGGECKRRHARHGDVHARRF